MDTNFRILNNSLFGMDVLNVFLYLCLSFTVSLTEEFRWHWLLIEGMRIEAQMVGHT